MRKDKRKKESARESERKRGEREERRQERLKREGSLRQREKTYGHGRTYVHTGERKNEDEIVGASLHE